MQAPHGNPMLALADVDSKPHLKATEALAANILQRVSEASVVSLLSPWPHYPRRVVSHQNNECNSIWHNMPHTLFCMLRQIATNANSIVAILHLLGHLSLTSAMQLHWQTLGTTLLVTVEIN